MANEERRVGPRRLAPKLPTNESTNSSSSLYAPHPRHSQEPSSSTVTKPKRAQVRAACVACQRGKAKVSALRLDAIEHINGSIADKLLQVRWYEAILQQMRETRPCLRIRRGTGHFTFHLHATEE